MAAYVARRVVLAALLVVSVSSAAFVLARLAPGDYVTDSLGIDARRDRAAEARQRAGLDRPIAAQWADWLGHASHLDLGHSLLYDRPVADLVPERAANTAVLALTALLAATLIGIPAGVFTGSHAPGWQVSAIRGVSLFLLSVPPLLTSLVLVFVAARTGWFPLGGMTSASGGGFVDLLHHLALPALALALPLAATLERLQSQSTAEVIAQPFITAARARGLSHTRIVWRGAFKAALTPTLGIYGVMVGTVLGGSFVVEVVTAWPGLGRLMLDALRARDVYLVAGCAAAGAAFLALGTLAADVALAVVNPLSQAQDADTPSQGTSR